MALVRRDLFLVLLLRWLFCFWRGVVFSAELFCAIVFWAEFFCSVVFLTIGSFFEYWSGKGSVVGFFPRSPLGFSSI